MCYKLSILMPNFFGNLGKSTILMRSDLVISATFFLKNYFRW